MLKKAELGMAHGGHSAKDGGLAAAWCREWRVEAMAQLRDCCRVEKVKIGAVKCCHGGCVGCTWARGGSG